MRLPSVAAMSVLLASCATLPGPEADSTCAATTYPADPQISGSFTDRFNGTYYNGAESLVIRREEQRLYVGPPHGPWRQLQRAGGGDGAYRDGCGTSYVVFLPPDGPGGFFVRTEADGSHSEWHRRS